MNCIVQELFLGTPVEAKWVDGNSYEAVVIGFPPNTERVRVKFINDGIKYSALLQHVTTCSNKESQGLEAGSSSPSSIVGRMPVADEEMPQHRMQLPDYMRSAAQCEDSQEIIKSLTPSEQLSAKTNTNSALEDTIQTNHCRSNKSNEIS
ncbi:hypothetical protein EB796_003095 [Bugula neritina]|uniref:Uncharacterized protein n=1 Tax=Bugula neritina TaxID=10212 RepID=A0A7J7KJZ4_BUGNE|nr:hypothetical protein EB796_003095 [Bugula neritina]